MVQRNPGRRSYLTADYIFGNKKKLDYELGSGGPQLKKGFSFDKAHQDQKPAGYLQWSKDYGGGASRGGRTEGGFTAYYEKVKPQAPTPTAAPAAAPPPPPPP